MITSFYLSLLAFLYFKMSMDTIKARRKHKVSLGTGDNNELLGHVSAHSNFQAYVPLIGILLYSYEQGQMAHPLVIHALGLTVLAGRLLHYYGVKDAAVQNFKFRAAGMKMTLIPLIITAALNIINFAYVTRVLNES